MNVTAMPRIDPLLREEHAAPDQTPVLVVICQHQRDVSGVAQSLRRAEGIEVQAVAAVEDVERFVRDVLPDVVLMDLRTPRLDAVAAIRRIREASPTTRIVALSASARHRNLYPALRAGATGHVDAHTNVTAMATALRAVARGHCVIPAHLAATVLDELEAAGAVTVSDVEREILAGLARGHSPRDIGRRHHITEAAFSRHVDDIYSKLHLTDRLMHLPA